MKAKKIIRNLIVTALVLLGILMVSSLIMGCGTHKDRTVNHLKAGNEYLNQEIRKLKDQLRRCKDVQKILIATKPTYHE